MSRPMRSKAHEERAREKARKRSEHAGRDDSPRDGKKMSIRTKVIIVGLFIGAFILGGTLFAGLPSGFLSWDVSSINGYPVGSDQLTNAGQFSFSDGTVNWKGRIQRGNLYYADSINLDWMQVGNMSVAVRLLRYQGAILTYLQMRPPDVIPGLNIETNTILGEMFYYKQDQIASTLVVNNMKANCLKFPGTTNILSQTVPLANVNDVLHATIGVDIQVDPLLIGESFPTTFNDDTQTFTLQGVWAGTLKAQADNVLPAQTGLISQPGPYITSANFSNPVETTWGNPDAAAHPDLAAGANPTIRSGTTSVGAALDTQDPGYSGNHFRTSQVNSVMYAGSDWEAAMGLGDPITITRADTGGSLNPTFDYGLLNDTSRNVVTAWIPMDIAPKTTITQTTYTFNNFHTWDSFGFHITSSLGKTETVPTAISVANSFILQPIEVFVILAANYSGAPFGCSSDPMDPLYCAPLGPPHVDGDGDAFNTDVTSKVDDVQGEYYGMFDDIGAWIIWIVIGIIAVAVIVVVIKFKKNKGKNGETPGEENVLRLKIEQ